MEQDLSLSALKEWKQFLSSLNRHEKEPSVEYKRISSVFDRIRKCDETELKPLLTDLFRSLSRSFPEKTAAAFVLCCHVAGIEVREAPVIMHEFVPARRNADFEEILDQLLIILRNAETDLNAEISADFPLLRYLTRVAEYLSENSFPVPVTPGAVNCLRTLAKLHPSTIEPRLGRFSACVLFNIDNVDPEPFWTDLVETFFKMRQLPKLVAKTLISATESEKSSRESDKRLSAGCSAAFQRFAARLSHGQIFELWKTLNFHLKRNPRHDFVDFLLSAFLTSICVADHKTPRSTLVKTAEFIRETGEHLTDDRKSRKSLSQLISLLLRYRGENLADLGTVLMESDPDSDCDITNNRDDDGKLAESEALQTSIVVDLVKHCEVFDVDANCETVFKTLKDGEFLLRSAEIDRQKKLRRIQNCLNALQSRLIVNADRSNHDLDPKFYFRKALTLLRRLPLESLNAELNLTVLAVTFALLAVCTHDEVIEPLLEICARSLDPCLRNSTFLKYVDGSGFMAWISRRKWNRSRGAEQISALLAQMCVKYIVEYEDTWKDFAANLDALSADSASAAVWSEAVEKPLLFRDASEEKIRLCEERMRKIAENLNRRLENFENSSPRTKLTLMRVATSVLSTGFEIRSERHLRLIFAFALTSESSSSSHGAKFLRTCLKPGGGDSRFPADYKLLIWNKMLEDDSHGLIPDILDAVAADQMEALFRNVEAASKLCPLLVHLVGVKLEDEAKIEARRRILEAGLSKLHAALSDDEVDATEVLRLENAVLSSEKPVVSGSREADCLTTSLTVDIETADRWTAVYSVLHSAFSRRSNSLVIPRIPLVLTVFRKLLHSLDRIGDDERQRFETFSHQLDRICDQMKKRKEDFARVAPFIIADIAGCGQKRLLSSNLTFACNKLLDICDKHSKDYLTSALPDNAKVIYQQILDNYNQYYKYTGQI